MDELKTWSVRFHIDPSGGGQGASVYHKVICADNISEVLEKLDHHVTSGILRVTSIERTGQEVWI